MEKSFRKGIVVTPSDFNGVDWIGKMKNAGLNTLGIHSGGGAAHNVMEKLEFTADDAFQHQISAAGIDFEYELHAPFNLMRGAVYEEHPEYFPFSLRLGERVNGGNWCVSNSDVMRLIPENAAFLAGKLRPSTKRHFFWGADTIGGDWCYCENCSNFSSSDQNLMTANAIAERLTKDDSEAQICCIAYLSTLEAPHIVKPHPNVFAEYAPYFRCYRHALCDSHCAVNRAHLRKLLDLLEVFTPEKMHVLEYWLDSSLFGLSNHPPHRSPFQQKVAECDIKFYSSLGIRSITTFAVCMDGEYMAAYGDREFQEYAEILSAL